ncbi:MAG: hypothetical protein VX694_14775, partial [Planctomycetota bacterium]|nr:hypothetical protein [Planctomycetota bacterium]
PLSDVEEMRRIRMLNFSEFRAKEMAIFSLGSGFMIFRKGLLKSKVHAVTALPSGARAFIKM